MAGVVNIILKDNFEGIKANAQYGISDEGDYHTSTYGVTAGVNYGRGNAVVHVSHSDNGLLTRRDRDLGTPYRFVSNPANTSSTDGILARIPVRNLRIAFFGIPTLTAFLPFGANGQTTNVIFDSALGTFSPSRLGLEG